MERKRVDQIEEFVRINKFTPIKTKEDGNVFKELVKLWSDYENYKIGYSEFHTKRDSIYTKAITGGFKK